MPIKVLDPKVISRIAAGEVVERPASVVKELLENSLDAGSSDITVAVEGSGITLIRVSDNGAGIPANEIALAFARHATSKISSLGDLENIKSFGFRGEALSAIASVSDTEMVTRAEGEAAGYLISLRDGVITGEGSRARPVGTTVSVRNLFRRFPARLKFLKSPATENSRIVTIVSQYALAFPEVKFTLISGMRALLRTNGSGKLIDAISQVWGAQIARNMLDIGEVSETGGGGPVIRGMAGSPAVSRMSSEYISLFVNRRLMANRTLTRAVEEAYRGLLMVGRHPVAVISIVVSPGEVDVNVHPAKTEVKFQNERAVFGAVKKAVRQALVLKAPVPKVAEPSVVYIAPKAPLPVAEGAASESDFWSSGGTQAASLMGPRQVLPILRALGQVSNTYIVAEGSDGLYVIDQHAAHERILFEKILAESLERGIEIQWLLAPVSLEFSPREDALLKMHLKALLGFGFSLESFGSRTYLVRGLPAVLNEKDWQGALEELLDNLPFEGRSDFRERAVTTLACHSAVKAGDILSDKEIQELIGGLEKTSLPNTCPHGRPTIMKLEFSELEKRFGRV